MKLNAYLLTLILAICTSISTFYAANPRGTVIIENDGYRDDAVWIGPGWYYGIWFGDEYEYRQYYRHHRRHRDNRDHRDRRYRDHHDRPHNRDRRHR